MNPLRTVRVSALLSLVPLCSAIAQLTVNPSVTVTHLVEIQPIIVVGNEGRATFFGSPQSEAVIKGEVSAAWGQLGVSITWNDPVEYVDDFTYDGSKASYYSGTARPQSHLSDIMARASSPPKHPDVTVINLFFVEIVPGFTRLADNAANGLAFVDMDGSAIHVGSDLVKFRGGQDAVASVVAHEIGHCLGLLHHSSTSNLMYSGNKTACYLTASQKDRIFTDDPGVDGYDFLLRLNEYSQWAAVYHVGDPGGDDDGDGKSNALEFMAGSNPAVFTTSAAANHTAAGPVWSFARNPEAVAAGYRYRIRTGPDLAQMFDAGLPGSGSTIVNDQPGLISVRLDKAAGPRGFMIVDVDLPNQAQADSLALAGAEQVDRRPVIAGCADPGCQHVIRVDLPWQARLPDGGSKR